MYNKCTLLSTAWGFSFILMRPPSRSIYRISITPEGLAHPFKSIPPPTYIATHDSDSQHQALVFLLHFTFKDSHSNYSVSGFFHTTLNAFEIHPYFCMYASFVFFCFVSEWYSHHNWGFQFRALENEATMNILLETFL